MNIGHFYDLASDDILALYGQGYFKNLIISGGLTQPDTHSEAQMILDTLVKGGIPEHILILEDKAMNTGQNGAFAREKVKDLGITELLLIGKISSKRRYVMTVRKQWPEIRRICSYGVNYFSCAEEHWWKDRESRKRVISECRKIRSYIEKEFISDISIIDGVVVWPNTRALPFPCGRVVTSIGGPPCQHATTASDSCFLETICRKTSCQFQLRVLF